MPLVLKLAPRRRRTVLDLQIPGLTGFDLGERLERDLPVIFTTAYDRYSRDAFAVNSIDYHFSKDKVTFAVSAGPEHAMDYTLADLEGRLDPRRFVRIHRASDDREPRVRGRAVSPASTAC